MERMVPSRKYLGSVSLAKSIEEIEARIEKRRLNKKRYDKRSYPRFKERKKAAFKKWYQKNRLQRLKEKIMKKIILAVLFVFAVPCLSHADSILDRLYGGFVGRAKFAMESTTSGKSQGEFLVNYVEIGKTQDQPIAAIDAGILGTVLPDSGHFQAADFTTGGKLHLSPIIKSFVPLPAEWAFLAELELDARGSYNWREHHPYWGLVAAIPFR